MTVRFRRHQGVDQLLTIEQHLTAVQTVFSGAPATLTEDYNRDWADMAHTYNDGTEYHTRPYPDDFTPCHGPGVYTEGDPSYRCGGATPIEGRRRPQPAEDTTIPRLHDMPQEVEPVPETVMPVVRRSEDAATVVAATTDDRLMATLGGYAEHLGAERPATVEDCFDMITDLTGGVGPSGAIYLLTRQLQAARRTPEESVAEMARVEELNNGELADARLDAQRELAAFTSERWRHYLGEDRFINNNRDFRATIDVLAESRRWGIATWRNSEAADDRATQAASRVEEVVSERNEAAVQRDAAIAAEADARMRAAARGEALAETVTSLRGAVATLDGAEALLVAASERDDETDATNERLRQECVRAEEGRAVAERERGAYADRVRHVQQTLVATRQAVLASDSRRVRAETATATARQELSDARAERDAATARRDALEEVVLQLTQERDTAVTANSAVRSVRERLAEAIVDVERLTHHVNELYQTNLAQVEPFYAHQRGGPSNDCVLGGLEGARAYNAHGDGYLQQALAALGALVESRCLGEAAAIQARQAALAARQDSDIIDGMQFRRRMARARRVQLIQLQRATGRRLLRPPPIVDPVPTGDQARQDDETDS